ncbi:hypothetical protein PMIN06_006515 [Paraphaeosphaeria minitans]
MPESRPFIRWNAVKATKNELPIYDVAAPVFRSADIVKINVDTLVLSMNDTKSAIDKTGIAISNRLGDRALVWPPMLRVLPASLSTSESTESDSSLCASSFTAE